PGGKGTMRRMIADGQLCARACKVANGIAALASTSARRVSLDINNLPIAFFVRIAGFWTEVPHPSLSFRDGAQRRTRNPETSTNRPPGFRVRAFRRAPE